MEINRSKNFSQDEITKLFLSVNWESAGYPEKLLYSVLTSETVLSCRENEKLIGLMTAISDGGMNVFFPYLLISPDYQNKGIGKALVSEMLEIYRDYYRRILICSNEKAEFYKKCGMNICNDQIPITKIN